MEQIKLMLDKLATDSALAAELQTLAKNEDAAAIVAFAKENGFDFSEDDWQEFTKWSKSVVGTVELNEEELEDVAGGGNGSIANPHTSNECWWEWSSNPLYSDKEKDGRRYCGKVSCIGIAGFFEFYRCKCWGTEKCKDGWHPPVRH